MAEFDKFKLKVTSAHVEGRRELTLMITIVFSTQSPTTNQRVTFLCMRPHIRAQKTAFKVLQYKIEDTTLVTATHLKGSGEDW